MAHNKIHVNSSTGLSLNERFTAIAERSTEMRRQRSRSRSRSLVREIAPINPSTSQANRRLLLQLERRHKMLVAMRVKRRSLRPTGTGLLKRGSIKALRVAANGRPIKANSLTNVATMKADLISNTTARRVGAGGRTLRRANSTSNLGQRLGVNLRGNRRRMPGGAAERVAKRRLERLRAEIAANARSVNNAAVIGRRGRSRSRTRLNTAPAAFINNGNRGRSRSRSRNRLPNNGRAQSRNRAHSRNVPTTSVRRGRSMSRNRDRAELPIKARLGVRNTGATPAAANGRRNIVNNQRSRSKTRVIRGRVDKRANRNGVRINGGQGRVISNGGRAGPARGRSRSRTRNVQQQDRQRLQQRQGRVGPNSNNRRIVGRRGRSRQRGPNNNNNSNNNNRQGNGIKNGQRQQQNRRGRSISRSRRGGGGGGRNLGQNSKKTNVKKEDLDKELDHYMATTKSDNDVDYLLKN